MRRAALRWGFLLALALLALAGLGYRNQLERQRYLALRAEHQALTARVRALEAELAATQNPKDLLRWAQEHGFLPLAEGRWAR